MATTTLQPSARQRLARWWQLRSATERMSLALVAGLVFAAFAWLALWRPLVDDIERTAQRVAARRATLAEARRQADDIATLARSAASPLPRDARADLDAALSRQALKATAIDRLDNERLRVSFDAIGFDELVALCDSLQRGARLRVVDATSTARVEPGQVRAELTLSP
jgi:type II secretory pathway component PulM